MSSNILDHGHLIVSCSLGPQFGSVYEAVPGFRNVFFSNNIDLRHHAETQGWNFVFLDMFPLSEDVMVSSLQAKWVKFLQFLGELPGYENVSTITYHDHKFKVMAEHLEWILANRSLEHDLLIRETPREKLSINDEISDAMGQERYVRHMENTISYLDSLEVAGKMTRSTRIVNTGFIHYRNLLTCRPFADGVYRACTRLEQPECQIICAAHSQMSDIRIQKVPWKMLQPIWKTPNFDDS